MQNGGRRVISPKSMTFLTENKVNLLPIADISVEAICMQSAAMHRPVPLQNLAALQCVMCGKKNQHFLPPPWLFSVTACHGDNVHELFFRSWHCGIVFVPDRHNIHSSVAVWVVSTFSLFFTCVKLGFLPMRDLFLQRTELKYWTNKIKIIQIYICLPHSARRLRVISIHNHI